MYIVQWYEQYYPREKIIYLKMIRYSFRYLKISISFSGWKKFHFQNDKGWGVLRNALFFMETTQLKSQNWEWKFNNLVIKSAFLSVLFRHFWQLITYDTPAGWATDDLLYLDGFDSSASCQCNEACFNHNDCCSDYLVNILYS